MSLNESIVEDAALALPKAALSQMEREFYGEVVVTSPGGFVGSVRSSAS